MIKGTMYYVLSVALMRGISLLMLPVVARFISPEGIGELEILSSIAILGSVLVGAGLESALFRFAGGCDTHECRKIAATTYLLSIFVGIVFILFAYASLQWIEGLLPGELAHYSIVITLAIVCFESAIAVPLGYLRLMDEHKRFFCAVVLRVVLQAGLTLLFLLMGRGVSGVLEATLVATVIQALLLGIWHVKSCGYCLYRPVVKTIVRYVYPIIGSGILAFGINGIDRWAVAAFSNLDKLALYAIALKFSIALTMLMQPFGMWWMPRRFAVLNKSKQEVEKYSTLGLVLLVWLYVAVGVFAPVLIVNILPDFYQAAVPLFLVVLLSVALKEACEIVNIGCFAGDDTHYQFIINLGCTVLCVVLILVFGKFYNVYGIAWAISLTQLLRLCAFYLFSQREVDIAYPRTKLIFLFGAAVTTVFFSYAITRAYSSLNIFLLIFFSIMLLGMLVFISLSALYRCGFREEWGPILSKASMQVRKCQSVV